MKNQLALLALAATLTTSVTAQTKPAAAGKPYVVKGQIQGLTKGMVYFRQPNGSGFDIDSMMSTNGHFQFKGTMPNAGMAAIWLPSNLYSLATIFMDGGTVTVMAKKDSLDKATVTGAPLNVLYKAHRQELYDQVFTKFKAIDQKYAAMKASPKDKLPDSLSKLYRAEIQYHYSLADSVTRLFIGKHPNSLVSPFLAMSYYSMESDAKKLPALYALFTPDVKNSYWGQQIPQLLSNIEKVGIGRTAKDFTLADTTGKMVSLSSIKRKYVLVDFWASWCGPCRKENPNVVSAYKKYHDKGFEIVGISLDTKKNLWEKAINADGLSWYHVSDLQGWKSGILEPYVVKVVPTSYLLDQDGKIVAKNLRGEDLHKKLAELLDPKP